MTETPPRTLLRPGGVAKQPMHHATCDVPTAPWSCVTHVFSEASFLFRLTWPSTVFLAADQLPRQCINNRRTIDDLLN